MNGNLTTSEVLEQGLRNANTSNTAAILKNSDLFSFLVSNFNNTLKLASGKPADVVIGLTSKALTTGKVAGKAAGSNGLIIGSTAAQIIVTTAGLVSVAGKGPASAVVAVGAAFAKKTSLALSLAGGDDKKAKCLAALTDLAASGLTTGLLASTSITGVGAIFLAGSFAQLVLSAYQVHEACTAPK